MSYKPWKNYAAVPPKEPKSKPAIPANLVSVPSQRLVVFSAYVFLQSLKLKSDRTLFNFVVFSGFDTAFWLFLPLLSIPWLRFKWSVILLLSAGSVCFDYTWFVYKLSFTALLAASVNPVGAILHYLGIMKPETDNELITGKYVVDVLPEANATLSKVGKLCFPSPNTEKSPIYLQLQMHNAWPSTVVLGKQDLINLDEYIQTTYDAKQLASLPSDSENIYLPVYEPGAYFLDRIVDGKSQLRVSIRRLRVVIPPCPSVQLEPANKAELCPGDKASALIKVSGVQPFKVYLDDQVVVVTEAANKTIESVTSLNKTIVKTVGGRSKFHVVKVEDAMGHTANVNETVYVDVRKPAQALVTYSKVPILNGSTEFKVRIDGTDFPFNAVFSGPDGDFNQQINQSGIHAIMVSKPGTYKLKSLAGSQCLGSGSGHVDVFTPPEIKVGVQFEDVVDKCAGPKGVDAKIKMFGSKPFRVHYQIYKNNALFDSGVSVYNENHAIMRFRPKDAGTYKYAISKVEDMYREQKLEQLFEQKIEELPGAELLALNSTKLCETGDLELNVKVSGKGPFVLKYSINKTRFGELNTATNVSSICKLKLDLETGKHQIQLVSLTDVNGCVTGLDNTVSPVITVQKQLPKLGFTNPGALKSTDPVNVSIPVNGTLMNYPATVYYTHELNGVQSVNSIVLQRESSIRASKPGTYKLLRVDDGVCGGEVDNTEVVINTYVRPSLELAAKPSGVCHKNSHTATSNVDVYVKGEKPFVIIHEQVAPDGQSLSEKFELQTSRFQTRLENEQTGVYKHYFWVMDSWYPDFNEKEANLKFSHEVYTSPNAYFSKKSRFEVCEGAKLGEHLVPKLEGFGPFELEYSFGNEVNKLVNTSFDFQKLVGAVNSSKKLKLLRVTDAHNCSSELTTKNEAEFAVLAKPAALTIDKFDYCVGDVLSVDLGGDISLAYNYTQLKHTVGAFETVANQPGTVQLLSLTGQNGCTRQTNQNLTVHPLPRSNITEQSHFSIYMGEQIELGFSFAGTPPFRFQYARLVDGVERERVWVNDVQGYNHSIYVDEGGTYEIVELHDKFCRSHRTRL